MPKSIGLFERGKIDLITLLGVGFLVTSLVAVLSFTSNPLKTVVINSYARYSAEARINKAERAAARGEGPQCSGGGCLLPELLANQTNQGTTGVSAPSDQQIANQKLIDTYNTATSTTADPVAKQKALDSLKTLNETSYNQAVNTNTAAAAAEQASEKKGCEEEGGTFRYGNCYQNGQVPPTIPKASLDINDFKQVAESSADNSQIAAVYLACNRDGAANCNTTNGLEQYSLNILKGMDTSSGQTTFNEAQNKFNQNQQALPNVLPRPAGETPTNTVPTASAPIGSGNLTLNQVTKNTGNPFISPESQAIDQQALKKLTTPVVPVQPTTSIAVNQQGTTSFIQSPGSKCEFNSQCGFGCGGNNTCKTASEPQTPPQTVLTNVAKDIGLNTGLMALQYGAYQLGIDISGVTQPLSSVITNYQTAQSQSNIFDRLSTAFNPTSLITDIELAKQTTSAISKNIFGQTADSLISQFPIIGYQNAATAAQYNLLGVAHPELIPQTAVASNITLLGLKPVIDSSNRLIYQIGLSPEEAVAYRENILNPQRVMDAVSVGLFSTSIGNFVASTGVVQGGIQRISQIHQIEAPINDSLSFNSGDVIDITPNANGVYVYSQANTVSVAPAENIAAANNQFSAIVQQTEQANAPNTLSLLNPTPVNITSNIPAFTLPAIINSNPAGLNQIAASLNPTVPGVTQYTPLTLQQNFIGNPDYGQSLPSLPQAVPPGQTVPRTQIISDAINQIRRDGLQNWLTGPSVQQAPGITAVPAATALQPATTQPTNLQNIINGLQDVPGTVLNAGGRVIQDIGIQLAEVPANFQAAPTVANVTGNIPQTYTLRWPIADGHLQSPIIRTPISTAPVPLVTEIIPRATVIGEEGYIIRNANGQYLTRDQIWYPDSPTEQPFVFNKEEATKLINSSDNFVIKPTTVTPAVFDGQGVNITGSQLPIDKLSPTQPTTKNPIAQWVDDKILNGPIGDVLFGAPKLDFVDSATRAELSNYGLKLSDLERLTPETSGLTDLQKKVVQDVIDHGTTIYVAPVDKLTSKLPYLSPHGPEASGNALGLAGVPFVGKNMLIANSILTDENLTADVLLHELGHVEVGNQFVNPITLSQQTQNELLADQYSAAALEDRIGLSGNHPALEYASNNIDQDSNALINLRDHPETDPRLQGFKLGRYTPENNQFVYHPPTNPLARIISDITYPDSSPLAQIFGQRPRLVITNTNSGVLTVKPGDLVVTNDVLIIPDPTKTPDIAIYWEPLNIGNRIDPNATPIRLTLDGGISIDLSKHGGFEIGILDKNGQFEPPTTEIWARIFPATPDPRSPNSVEFNPNYSPVIIRANPEPGVIQNLFTGNLSFELVQNAWNGAIENLTNLMNRFVNTAEPTRTALNNLLARLQPASQITEPIMGANVTGDNRILLTNKGQSLGKRVANVVVNPFEDPWLDETSNAIVNSAPHDSAVSFFDSASKTINNLYPYINSENQNVIRVTLLFSDQPTDVFVGDIINCKTEPMCFERDAVLHTAGAKAGFISTIKSAELLDGSLSGHSWLEFPDGNGNVKVVDPLHFGDNKVVDKNTAYDYYRTLHLNLTSITSNQYVIPNGIILNTNPNPLVKLVQTIPSVGRAISNNIRNFAIDTASNFVDTIGNLGYDIQNYFPRLNTPQRISNAITMASIVFHSFNPIAPIVNFNPAPLVQTITQPVTQLPIQNPPTNELPANTTTQISDIVSQTIENPPQFGLDASKGNDIPTLYENYYKPSPDALLASGTLFGNNDTAIATIEQYRAYMIDQMSKGFVLEASGQYGYHPELADKLKNFKFLYQDRNHDHTNILLQNESSPLYSYFRDIKAVDGQFIPITCTSNSCSGLNINQQRLYFFNSNQIVGTNDPSQKTPQDALNNCKDPSSCKYAGIVAAKSANDLGRTFLLYKNDPATKQQQFVGLVLAGDYAKRADWTGTGATTSKVFVDKPLGYRQTDGQQWGFDLSTDLYIDFLPPNQQVKAESIADKLNQLSQFGAVTNIIAIDPVSTPITTPITDQSLSQNNITEQINQPQNAPIETNNYVEKKNNGNVLFTTNYRQLPDKTFSNNYVTPTNIVLHWDGNSANPLTSPEKLSVNTTYNGLVSRKASVHFAVGYDGVMQMLPMTADKISESNGANGIGSAINIEFTGQDFNKQLPPQKEIDNAVDLITRLVKQYNLPVDQITHHPGQSDVNPEFLEMIKTLVNQKLATNLVTPTNSANILLGNELKPIDSKNKLDMQVIPSEIIIHWDGQPGAPSAWNVNTTYNGLSQSRLDPGTGLWRSTDAHFGIDKNEVVQFLTMKGNTVQFSYGANGYPTAINIEMAGSDFKVFSDGSTNVPRGEIDNTVNTIIKLMKQYNISIDSVFGHSEQDTTKDISFMLDSNGQPVNIVVKDSSTPVDRSKPDPGTNFMNFLRGEVEKKLPTNSLPTTGISITTKNISTNSPQDVYSKVVNDAISTMNKCQQGYSGLYNACEGGYYKGQILQQGDTVDSNFGGNPSSDPNSLYWCTSLVKDAAKASGVQINGDFGANSMYQDFTNKKAVTLTENANLNSSATSIKPGMVAFVTKESQPGYVGHVGIVSEVKIVDPTHIYVTIVQANAGTVQATYQLDQNGNLVDNVNGKKYYIRGFGDISLYGQNQ